MSTPRVRQLFVTVLVGALVGTLVHAPQANAAGPGADFVKPAVTPVPPVPVSPVAATGTTGSAPPAAGKAEPVWPAAGVADVELAPASSLPAGLLRSDGLPVRGGGPVKAGALPVRLASTDKQVGRIRAEVLDRATTERAKVNGVLLRVAPAGSAKGRVAVSVDYGSFATAFGADWSSRLRLVSLPECALSTPELAECAGTPVASINDPAAKTVSATVMAGAGAGLMALQAGPSGSAGSYAATSLQPSATWSAGGNSGAFNWNYPMRVPPSLGGPAPELALSYSSQSVDGSHAASNNQPSWVGEGWEFTPGGSIERRYKPCAKDMDAPANNTVKTGDMCWETDNAVLSLSGHSGELIFNAAEARWHLKNDDGTRVQRLTGAANGDNDGEYWVVTTVEGTQFWFGTNRLPGWTAGAAETQSTLTMPVFGNEPGEPCNAAAFANSHCTQAWRWNLDYVVDLSNNSASYWYVKETNRYGRNNTPSDAALYDRDAYLSHVAYGTRRDTAPEPDVDSVFTTSAPMKVLIGTADRCLANCGSHDEAAWPDTPWDGDCGAAPCSSTTPTFFTTRRLSTVTTQVWDGSAYRDVERWTFTHTFPDPGDGTRAGLWLSKISHAGLVGTTTTVPDVEFTGIQLSNRVDAIGDLAPAMNWWRIAMIRNETGGTISVNYSAPECVAGQPMPDPSTNTKRCYPVLWTPAGATGQVTDWFQKYVVTTIYEDAHTGGAPPAGSPRVAYTYSYLDGAAWHFADDDGLTDVDSKTWSQWRGYGRVGVTVGDPGEQTYSETRFMRGMHGDKLPSGTRTVMVPGTGVPDAADEDAFAGMTRETTTFNGPGGAVVSKQVNEFWQSAPTATRTINGTTVYARFNAPSASHTRVALDGNRPDRVTTTRTTFDAYGMPVAVDDEGDVAVTGDEKCTKTDYEPRNTSAWLMSRSQRTRTYALACSATGGTLTEADIIGETRTSYDNQTYGSMPTRGLLTRTETMATWNNGTPTFAPVGRSAYDSHGRETQSWNAMNALTTTAYTPATGGPVTTIATTNALNHTTTATVDPASSLQTSIVDPNGKRTDLVYDGLGRLTAVWLPNRDKATESASQTFSYQLRTDAATAIATSKLTGSGTYDTSYALYDGLLRLRQTQTPSPAGGRILTDVFYDTSGRQARSYGNYYATGLPDPTLVTATQYTDVPNQSRTIYDGAGRTVASVFQPYGVQRWTSTIAYGGDHTDSTPPAGGTATSSRTDGLGRMVELRQYHGPTPAGGYDATTYTYNNKGQQTQVTDSAGNDWSYTYDLRGRQITATDPDKGTTTLTYDDAGRVTSTLDARNKKLVFGYDPLDRRRTIWENQINGPMRAQWIYDTIVKGQLTQSTRFVGSAMYVVRTLGYTDLYQSTGTQIVVPTSETGLGGTYNFLNSFNDINGAVLSSSYPGTNGDLPAETVTYGYDDGDQLATLNTLLEPSTSLSLVTGTVYNAFGLIDQVTLDTDDVAGGRVYRTVTRELETQRVTGLRTDRDSVAPYTVADLRYSYDDAGTITKLADVAAGDTQCFQHDYLRRLTEAWTPTSGDCAAAPAANALGGPAPYWHSWVIDPVGNRTSQTVHSGSGNATTNYAYPAPGSVKPHTLTETSGAQVGAYTYDQAGNTLCRPAGTASNNCTTGANSQNLTWDPEGRLSTSADATGTTTYIYDADGNRLVRRDPSGKTLYLPGQEIRYTNGTGTTACTRYYSFAGETIASRTAAGLTWLTGDHQGTSQVAINQSTQATTTRRQNPYGQARGTLPAWPNTTGYVGGTNDNTGLVHLGAREYDATTGRFISDDPITNPGDPQQIHGYAYASNSPVTMSDPSGLVVESGGGGGGPSSGAEPTSQYPGCAYGGYAQYYCEKAKEAEAVDHSVSEPTIEQQEREACYQLARVGVACNYETSPLEQQAEYQARHDAENAQRNAEIEKWLNADRARVDAERAEAAEAANKCKGFWGGLKCGMEFVSTYVAPLLSLAALCCGAIPIIGQVIVVLAVVANIIAAINSAWDAVTEIKKNGFTLKAALNIASVVASAVGLSAAARAVSLSKGLVKAAPVLTKAAKGVIARPFSYTAKMKYANALVPYHKTLNAIGTWMAIETGMNLAGATADATGGVLGYNRDQ